MKIAPIIILSLMMSACVTVTTNRADSVQSRAEAGNAESQYKMGLRYTNGQGVRQDYAKAVKWFNEAAMQGHAGAQYFSGVAYNTGRGIRQNHQTAAKLFVLAADQGHAKAQFQIGEAFINGKGVKYDPRWALRWYEMAAMQEHSGSMFMLGVAYASGLGVKTNNMTAWKWLDLASLHKYPQADIARERVASKMKKGQIRRAANNSASWKPVHSSMYANAPTVKYVQYGLKKLGYLKGKEDGILGARSGSAVAKFRTDTGLIGGKGITPDMVMVLRKKLSGTGS